MVKMQIVRYLFLVGIASIVFLHAIIPHSHHADMTQEQHQYSHQEANGLLDYFGLGFQEGFDSSLELFLADASVLLQLFVATEPSETNEPSGVSQL